MNFIEDQKQLGEVVTPPAYARWYSWLCDTVYMDQITNECKNVLTGLLTIDYATRLGCGVEGVRKLKANPWFEDISWGLLEQKLVSPPYYDIDNEFDRSICDPYNSFDSMLHDIGEDFAVYRYVAGLSSKEQSYFRSW